MAVLYDAEQVAPAELEAVLLSHPGVADAAVFGLPSPGVGELPTASVVLQPSARDVTEHDLMQFVQGQKGS